MQCEGDVCYITSHSGNNFVSASNSCAEQSQAYNAKSQQLTKTEDIRISNRDIKAVDEKFLLWGDLKA